MHFHAQKLFSEKNSLFFFANDLPMKKCIFMQFQASQ